MHTPNATTPEKILQLIGGAQATAILGTAATYRVFHHLEPGPITTAELAAAAKVSVRGAQALLDGLVGLGLVTIAGGRYANTKEASLFLVEGNPASLAGLAKVMLHTMNDWAKLPEAVRSGSPVTCESLETKDLEFWSTLVPAIAPLAHPAAVAVGRRLDVASRKALSILDVGGGPGIFSAVLLGANPEAKATQVDWPTINQIARGFVAKFGVADRFHTVDGDFHTADWGKGYDVAVYSNIAHQESPAQNMETFRRFRAALAKGGTLVVSDFVVNDDRSGSPHALLFHSQMLIAAREGATWREADYRAWLTEAGFTKIEVEPTPGASTLIYASAG
jgi:hypothetical protein